MRTPLFHILGQAFIQGIFFLLFFATLSPAETSPAFIKTELKKNEKIWQGQKQILYVKLYTTSSFTGSTRFELPKVSGMLIMESEDHPLLGTEKMNGVSYIFKQHEIALFPQRAGTLNVPPLTVGFAFRGPENKPVEQSFSTDKLDFTVEKIPGADPKRPVITTTNLHVDDHWEPAVDKAKVGDAFTRTLTMTADDLPGMAFPPFKVQKIEGLGLYTRQPQVADQMQRGEFTGKRIEAISYVCERQGSFHIPEAHVQWWNPKSESLQNIILEGVELKVDANPLLQKESPAESTASEINRFSWKWVTVLLLFSGVTGGILIWQRRRKTGQSLQMTDTEKELFDEFQKISASHDAAATMQALLHWLDHSNLSENLGNLARFIELADDSELREQIEALETTLYAREGKTSWSGDKLCRAVQRARKKLKQHKSHCLKHNLPALNP